MTKTHSKLIGDAGEHYALSQFSFCGKYSAKMPDNWEGYDLAVESGQGLLRVSVKTRTESDRFKTSKWFSFDDRKFCDWYVFIFKRKDGLLKSWVIPHEVCIAFANKPGPDRKDPWLREISWVKLTRGPLAAYENNWELNKRWTAPPSAKKQIALKELGAQRRATNLSEKPWSNSKVATSQVKNIGDFSKGYYDCDWVSPYTKAASNAEAEVFIVLQDWASADWFANNPDNKVVQALGYSPDSRTNLNLIALLKKHLDLDLRDAFVTNLFPFVKPGAMTNRIPMSQLRGAARDFALPQIDIVKPKLVVCLGIDVFNALAKESGQPTVSTVGEGIKKPFVRNETTFWCQAHTGMQGLNNQEKHGGTGQVDRDWSAMAQSPILKRK